MMMIEEMSKAPTSANIHTTSSMKWSLLCEELSMSSLSCKMMTTTRRQSQKVSIVWKPPWPSSVATPIMEVNSDTMVATSCKQTRGFSMDPSCRLVETALYMLLKGSTYYNVETACIYFSIITSARHLPYDLQVADTRAGYAEAKGMFSLSSMVDQKDELPSKLANTFLFKED